MTKKINFLDKCELSNEKVLMYSLVLFVLGLTCGHIITLNIMEEELKSALWVCPSLNDWNDNREGYSEFIYDTIFYISESHFKSLKETAKGMGCKIVAQN